MKYNPDYHSAVVSNLRTEFKKRNPGVELKLSDEEVWNCQDQNIGFGTGEDDENEALDDMKRRNDKLL